MVNTAQEFLDMLKNQGSASPARTWITVPSYETDKTTSDECRLQVLVEALSPQRASEIQSKFFGRRYNRKQQKQTVYQDMKKLADAVGRTMVLDWNMTVGLWRFYDPRSESPAFEKLSPETKIPFSAELFVQFSQTQFGAGLVSDVVAGACDPNNFAGEREEADEDKDAETIDADNATLEDEIKN